MKSKSTENKERFFADLIEDLPKTYFTGNSSKKDFAQGWKEILKKYPKLVSKLEKNIYNRDLVHHLGLVLNISGGETTRYENAQYISALEGYVDKAALESSKNSRDYKIVQKALEIFNHSGQFHEIEILVIQEK